MASLPARVKQAARASAHTVTDRIAALTPDAGSRPPWERSIWDDVGLRRPWNLRIKAARQLALRRADGLQSGVTVVIVNWNTRDVTADVLRAVEELSPPNTRVLLVDNGSTDGSRELFQSWAGIDTMLLRSNAGHGVALDLALCHLRTRIAVTLDSDAIPLRRGWLEPAVAPIREGRAVLAGLRARRNFVHPVYAAVDTAEFLRRRLSFQTFVPAGVDSRTATWGTDAWDTAELLTPRLAPDEVVFVERSDNLVSGLPGMTTGDVVYHHGGISRGTSGGVDPEAFRGWQEACRRLREAVEASTAARDLGEPGISIVMPVRNAAATIGEQLDALAAMDRPDTPFELIVADNGSTDETAAIARAYGDRLPVRVVDAGASPGSNFARNCGIQAARFDHILLCDGDDRVDRGWLVAMANAFAAGHELVVGPIDYRILNPPVVRAWRGADRAFAECALNFLPSGHGANMGFTRALYDRLGGFDDDFEFGGDDVELCWRAQLAGVPLRPVPDAVVHYRIRQSVPALYKQSRAYGAAEAHLFSKFEHEGMPRRPATALLAEAGWFITRLPFARSKARRGAWLRKFSRQIGRFEGALRYRVVWW